MKVLVTGATGFIGSWVVRELLAAGHSVRALVRSSSKLDNLSELLGHGAAIEPVTGDVLSAPAVQQAVAGCDAVIHTAGIAHFRPGEREQMERVNHGSVELVFEAALAAGVKRAILTSSMAALGGTVTPTVLDEKWPSNAESLRIDYFTSKLRGEQAALRFAGRGLSVTVVRPSFATGPGDIYHSSASTILALARRRLPVYVQGGSSFVDVRDLARGHLLALDRGRPGEIYHLGGHNLDMGTLVATVARLTGVEAPPRVPYPLAFAVAGAIELAAEVVGQSADLSRQLLRASHLYTFASSKKAQDELGYSFRPLEESLLDTLRYFMRVGRLQPTTPELRQLASELPPP